MTEFARLLATPERRFAALAGALMILRIAALVFGDAGLGPDEGQYWFWSKTPDFGYYSKPPLIAWSIAVTTALFGDAEWAVRLAAPFYHLGAAIFLFLLARRIAGPREAFWAGAAWLTLPGVFLSSTLITTDAPLMFFWSAAVYFFFLATDREDEKRGRWAALLGAAIGLGFLAKYAMSYFLISAALALLLSPQRRSALRPTDGAIAAIIAAIFITPNVMWNARNDFQTLAHTAANANWSGDFGHPAALMKFLGDQFAIAGPILLALICLAVLFGRRAGDETRRDDMQTLLLLAAPALIIVALQSFISRAHGNWAAAAYPSAIAMAAIWALRDKRSLFAFKAGLAAHLAIGLGFLFAFTNAGFAEAVGADRAFKPLRGWDEIGARIKAASVGYDAIMTDDREITGELVYYARNSAPIVAWNSNNRIDNHFEAFNAYDPARDKRVLYVTENGDAAPVKERFRAITPLETVSVRTSRRAERTVHLFEVSGFIAE
ncbi:MAG: ArnT family glycosyltransferase [Parvularculaceae bacterium]